MTQPLCNLISEMNVPLPLSSLSVRSESLALADTPGGEYKEHESRRWGALEVILEAPSQEASKFYLILNFPTLKNPKSYKHINGSIFIFFCFVPTASQFWEQFLTHTWIKGCIDNVPAMSLSGPPFTHLHSQRYIISTLFFWLWELEETYLHTLWGLLCIPPTVYWYYPVTTIQKHF